MVADDLTRRVLDVVSSVPPGAVTTYGEVAAEAGAPGAARAVGRILAGHGADVPWWRVVTAGGRLVPGGEARQAALLAAEGVEVADGHVVVLRRAGRRQR
jgi:methylated-DNA-protein-cysteine methyltransferase related protein